MDRNHLVCHFVALQKILLSQNKSYLEYWNVTGEQFIVPVKVSIAQYLTYLLTYHPQTAKSSDLSYCLNKNILFTANYWSLVTRRPAMNNIYSL